MKFLLESDHCLEGHPGPSMKKELQCSLMLWIGLGKKYVDSVC